MADDRDARIAQLEAELRRRDERDAAAQRQIAALHDEAERLRPAIAQALEEQIAAFPENPAALGGMGAQMVTPLLRDGRPIGTLALLRRAILPFTAGEVRLAETFADQAVIATENARLFEELEQRNGELQERTTELSEALEQQSA